MAEKYSSTYKVKRDSSIDDLMKTLNENRAKRRTEIATATTNDDDNDSGRSTPDYLKKYSVNYHFSNKGKTTDENESTEVETTPSDDSAKKRLRTFSETLKMLDDDILADLDVK